MHAFAPPATDSAVVYHVTTALLDAAAVRFDGGGPSSSKIAELLAESHRDGDGPTHALEFERDIAQLQRMRVYDRVSSMWIYVPVGHWVVFYANGGVQVLDDTWFRFLFTDPAGSRRAQIRAMTDLRHGLAHTVCQMQEVLAVLDQQTAEEDPWRPEPEPVTQPVTTDHLSAERLAPAQYSAIQHDEQSRWEAPRLNDLWTDRDGVQWRITEVRGPHVACRPDGSDLGSVTWGEVLYHSSPLTLRQRDGQWVPAPGLPGTVVNGP